MQPGGGVTLSFPVKAPARIGTVSFRVTATAGDWSDGELRQVPVLPGRMHLAQSRFATLRDKDRRVLRFPDMAAGDDPTLLHDQLVVTIDAQLFNTVLSALPYLAQYPYECTEQTLNRFLSAGIVSKVFADHPALAKLGKELAAQRDTPLEPWALDDPNRRMALEETPWLVTARGGDAGALPPLKILDPDVARAQRDTAIAKLQKAQTSLGAFPWFPGGPPSPYMTLYILAGLSRAREAGIEVPQDMVVQAWSYMHRHYLDEMVREMRKDDCCWETVTLLGFVLSNYEDRGGGDWTGGVFTKAERREMLEFSFKHWKKHSPLLKGMLALTLHRAGRAADAKLVFDSVMDSAKTTEDEGTFWAPEDRAWLWYNDTIETHAFALRTLSELQPKDARRHGLVQWLLLNKKLNHWSSTRGTAEVIYALVAYLESEGALGKEEAVRVRVGGKERLFRFLPDRVGALVEGNGEAPAAGGGAPRTAPGPAAAPRVESARDPRAGGGFADDVGGRGREGDQGLRLRLGDLALLHRAAAEGRARRSLLGRALVLPPPAGRRQVEARAARRGHAPPPRRPARGAPVDPQPRRRRIRPPARPAPGRRRAGEPALGLEVGDPPGLRGGARQRRQLLLRVAAGRRVHLQAPAAGQHGRAPSASRRPSCSRCTRRSSTPTRRGTW